MEWYILTIIILLVLFAMLATGMPIAFALAMLGFGGYWLYQGFVPALSTASHLAYRIGADFVMSTVPLFMLMGELLVIAGIGADLFNTAHKWLGRLPGGLAIAGIGACGMFGAMCGSSIATVVTIGVVAVPEMTKRGYDRKLAVGSITAGGALGPIIPPSIIMIIYAVMTEQSIGKLFIAAVIPGVITMLFLMLQVLLMVLRQPELAPKAPGFTWKERIISIKGVWAALLLIFLVLGTIYLGVCTPTEAAALGAFGAFGISLAMRRLNWSALWAALLRTVQTTAMILIILVGARIFAYFLTVLNIPQDFSTALVSLEVSRWLVMAGVQIIWLALGIFLDVPSIIVITSPLFVPPLVALGFSPIYIGAVLMVNMALAVITPPMAMNLFVAASTFRDIPFGEIVRGTLPFAIAELVALVVVVAFPVLSLWLPATMMK